MTNIAVLLSGGVNAGSNYSRYLKDLREMYRALVDKNGYAKSNIFVLYADGSAHDLDGDGNSEIHAACTLTELKNLFQTTLPPLVSNKDLLFIFSTNHGGAIDVSTQRARLWLWRESIADSEFAALVNNLTFRYLVVCMEQCYSGGFVDDLAGSNRVIATACRHDEVSWACDSEGDYDEFCYHWTAAVRGQKPGGQSVSADMDGDGYVSLRDAFVYAESNDSQNEHPQYYESPANLGSQLSLSGIPQVFEWIKYGRTTGVTHRWHAGNFQELPLPSGYDTPVFLAAMQTFKESDTAGIRIKALAKDTFHVKIEEETSADPEVSHVAETIGYIAFTPFEIKNKDGQLIGYSTFLDIQQPNANTWISLPVPADFSVEDSVVFAQVLTYNGGQPVHPRISKKHPSSGAPGFYLKLEEWPTYDKFHVGEHIGMVVLKKGFHALGMPREPHLMVGEINNVNHTWKSVDLGNTIGGGQPVLVTQCQTYNGRNPVVTRQREPAALKADVRLQEAESQGAHTGESVGYVAVGIPFG